MKTNGPWKIKDGQIKYKNPWISVREDQVIRPDGKDGIFGVVEMVAGVSVLPIDDDGFVYLTKEFHYAIERDSIEVVSGAVDEGETTLDAAKRELKEELGVEAREWVDLGILNPFTTAIKSPATMFLAKGIIFSKANPEGTEKIDMVKAKLDDAVKMVMESEITHGPSCVLILKASKYLGKQKYMERQELEKIVIYLVEQGLATIKRFTDEQNPVIEYAAIFSKDDNEFRNLEQIAETMGTEVNKETIETGRTFLLDQPVDTVAGPVSLVKIRKPDDTRPQLGAPDFKIHNYSEFKEKYIRKNGNFTLMLKKDYEMIEIKGKDVLVYIPNKTLSERINNA